MDDFTVAKMQRDYDSVRPVIERASANQELDQDVMQRAIALSRAADIMHKRGIEQSERPPAIVLEIRDFMLANGMPTTAKERTGAYQPTGADAASSRVTPRPRREDVVGLMREHWQDPAGFHEALARLLLIEEHEYEPNVVEQIAQWLEDPVNNVSERAAADIAADVRQGFRDWDAR